jgi:hypothetical protein
LVVGLSEGASGYGGATTGQRLDQLMSATHTKWLREELRWSKIEPSAGKFSFSYYDHYMLAAAKRGMHVVALLNDAPRWAAPAAIALPANPTAYAQYVAAVVGRYGAHGSFWRKHPNLSGSAIEAYELWNEPYFGSGNNGQYDPARYANLVKAASTAGHALDPTAKFLLEAEMASQLNRVWTWWVDALYQAVPGLNSYFDGIAVHDFGHDTNTLPPMIAGQPYAGYGHIRRIEDIRRQFINHGAATKPFWIMETGWSTCTQTSIDCTTPARQAANLTTLFNYIRGTWKNWVQTAFIYRYEDGASPNTVQGGYGLAHLNGKAKPALGIFRLRARASALNG